MMTPVALRTAAVAVWVLLALYLGLFSPPEHPELGAYLLELATFRGNPVEVMIFQMMGLWPLAYLRLLIHERGRPPAWPFVVASFAVGAFALLPYLALQPTPPERGRPWGWQRSWWLSGFLLAGFFALAVYGLGWGRFDELVERFQKVRFLNVMTLDFLTLAAFYLPTLRSRAGP